MIRTLALCLVLGASVATAQPAPQTAADHYEQSKRYYAINDFDKAIAELKTAYTMAPDPVYLFNIAQALRKKGDCIGAIDYYRKYLRDAPKAPNRTKVEGFIGELESCAAQQKPVEPVDTKPVDTKPVDTKPIDTKPVDTKPVDTKPSETPKRPPRVERSRMSRLRLGGIATGGVGGVLTIGGAILAFNARSIQKDVEKTCNAECDWGTQRDIDQRGHTRAVQSRVLFGVGAAAITGGAVMFVLGKPKRESPVSVVPVDSGAVVVTSGRF